MSTVGGNETTSMSLRMVEMGARFLFLVCRSCDNYEIQSHSEQHPEHATVGMYFCRMDRVNLIGLEGVSSHLAVKDVDLQKKVEDYLEGRDRDGHLIFRKSKGWVVLDIVPHNFIPMAGHAVTFCVDTALKDGMEKIGIAMRLSDGSVDAVASLSLTDHSFDARNDVAEVASILEAFDFF